METIAFNYDDVVSGDTKIEHVTVTIAAGENLAAYTPIKHDSVTGNYKAVTADDTTAQFLTALAVDASACAQKSTVLKAITINPDFVVYPEGMTDIVKSGLFAGTPISVQERQPI